jgi:hypothetical protein
MVDLCRSPIRRNGDILYEMVNFFAEKKPGDEVNLEFTNPTFEPGTLEDNYNDDKDANQYIYSCHVLNSRLLHRATTCTVPPGA